MAAAAAGRTAHHLGFASCLAIAVACDTRVPVSGPVSVRVARAPGALPIGSPAPEDLLSDLRIFENEARRTTDFAHAATSDTALGTDPYSIRADPWARETPGGGGFVGLLRGRSVLVELDSALHETARLPAPESASGFAFGAKGEVFAVGELSSYVARYRFVGGKLETAGSIDLPGVLAMRDVATGPEGVVYVVEEHDGRLITFKPRSAEGPSAPVARVETTLCHAPFHVIRVGKAVLVDCLLDHAIVVRFVDPDGYPQAQGEVRIVHDGPMWGLDAAQDGSALLVAVGGVEDRPLDRTEGSFGFIDSFVTVYRIAEGRAVKLREMNTSALGVVTPKALKLSQSGQGTWELAVAGYGSDRLAIFDLAHEERVATYPLPPGSAMMDRLADGSFVIANPLLDAWVRATPHGSVVEYAVDVLPSARSVDTRLGEALFFTTLMAPWNKSDGRLSRFTCETCHFEGYVDGRVHHTGRGEVHATTKPLLGLFNNRPHFSRALDPDLTTMVNNEFRVAGAKSDHDPWFSLSVHDFVWAKDLFRDHETLDPVALRRALMTFFMGFAHKPNPAVVGRSEWTDVERAGAVVFRDKCESCHEARLVSDDPSTRMPFERWEDFVMSREGPIVWAHAGYEKTGVVPYVGESGARVVSLRRLYKKYPYFTNGSGKDLHNVLDRVHFGGAAFFHDGAPEGAVGLREEEKTALLAFLNLL